MTTLVKKKILFFSAHLDLGGIEKVLLNYAKGLSKDDQYDIVFLTCKSYKQLNIVQLENIKFESLNINKIRNCVPSLRVYISRLKPNYLITASKWTLYAFIANALSGERTKIITSQHNYLANNPEVSFLHKLTLRYIYPFCYQTIAVSDGIEKLLNRDMICNKNKIVKIYNPIDTDDIRSLSQQTDNLSSKKYILFVGRLSKVKNIKLLISAFSIFAKSFDDVELIIIGEGNQKSTLEEQSSNIGLKNKISFLGTKQNPYPYISNAKLLCLSSISEAFPTVLLEALTLGITTVSTPTNGALEVLKNGKLGYLSATFNDENDYAKILNKGYTHPLEAQTLQNEITSNYSLLCQTEKLKKILI